MLSERDELTKINNRLELYEATTRYYGDKIAGAYAEIAALGQRNIDLKHQISELEKDISALRDCLAIREAGPQHVDALGPGDGP